MEKLSALFTTICDRFTGAAWFPNIQWPFWTFLFLIAMGGVYNACFKKNTLFCQGITGALKLAVVYMIAVGMYVMFPAHMSSVSELPFLSIGERTLTMVNPLGLTDRLFTAFPEVLVRLYALLFLINTAGHFDYGGKNFLPWLGSQVLSCSIPLVMYNLIFGALMRYWPFSRLWLYRAAACFFLIPLCLLMLAKLYFVIMKKSGNPTYAKAMQFFTAQSFGALFSISLFSLLAVLVFLTIVSLFGASRVTLAGFSWTSYVLILVMTIVTLFIYSMYYTERKPA